MAAIGEGDMLFAPIVDIFVMSSKKQESINGTHAAIAEGIISFNPDG